MVAYRLTVYEKGKKIQTMYGSNSEDLRKHYNRRYLGADNFPIPSGPDGIRTFTSKTKEMESSKLPKWIQKALINNQIAIS